MIRKEYVIEVIPSSINVHVWYYCVKCRSIGKFGIVPENHDHEVMVEEENFISYKYG